MEHKTAASYGIIPLYQDYNGYKLCIVQNAKGGHWGFPKGTPEHDEIPMQTAIRELQEETGIQEKDIRIEMTPTFTESYSFEKDAIKYDKTNTYYIGYVTNMTIGQELDEITQAQWVSFEEAKELFVNKAVLEVLKQLEDHMESLKEYNW